MQRSAVTWFFAFRFKCQINVKCCNLLSHVKPDYCKSKGRIHPKTELRFSTIPSGGSSSSSTDLWTLKQQKLILVWGGFHLNLLYMWAVMLCKGKLQPYMTTTWILWTISITKLLISSFEILASALKASSYILMHLNGTPAEGWIWLSRTLIYIVRNSWLCARHNVQSPR